MIYLPNRVNSRMPEKSYLDNPEDDGTNKAHPAYWRGRARGTAEILQIIKRVAEGNDPGDGVINSPVIEAARRILVNYKHTLDHAATNTKFVPKQATDIIKEGVELSKEIKV